MSDVLKKLLEEAIKADAHMVCTDSSDERHNTFSYWVFNPDDSLD